MSGLFMRVNRRLLFPWLLVAVAIAICAITYVFPPTLKQSDALSKAPPESDLAPETLVDLRLERYYADVESLNLDIQLQILAFLLCLVVLTGRAPETRLAFLDLAISNRWLHVALPCALVYFWLKFGYLLDQLIENRLAIFEMFQWLTTTNESVSDIWKLDQLLFDSGWVDAWFSVFLHEQSGIREPEGFAESAFTGLLYGTVIGLNHAFTLCLPAIGYLRFGVTTAWRLLYVSVIIILGFVLIQSHIQFAYGGRNPNWIHFVVLFFSLVFAFAIHIWTPIGRFDSRNDIPRRGAIESALTHSVNTLLIPERLFSVNRRIESPDWFERVSLADSRHYPEFRRYRSGEITKRELERELLHIAIVGDSLSTDFFVTSPLAAIWSSRTSAQKNWFLDTARRGDSGIKSVFERLNEIEPLVASQHSTARAAVGGGEPRTLVDILMKTVHMSGQIDCLLRAARFSDVVCIWIGHNALSWVGEVERPRGHQPRELERFLREFEFDYGLQVDRLLKHATLQPKRTAILVFGLVGFESFFVARAMAEEIRRQDQSKYPYLEDTYRFFPSLKPEFRCEVVEVAVKINAVIERLVSARQEEIRTNPNLQLTYSDAFASCDLSSADCLNEVDAWHPSPSGHRRLAAAAARPVADAVSFVRSKSARQ